MQCVQALLVVATQLTAEIELVLVRHFMAAILITKLIFHVIARATHDSEHYDGKEEADGDGDPSGEATALAAAKAAHTSLLTPLKSPSLLYDLLNCNFFAYYGDIAITIGTGC